MSTTLRRRTHATLTAAILVALGLLGPTAAGAVPARAGSTTGDETARTAWWVSRASVANDGSETAGTGPSESYRVPAISGDGRFVAFSSTAPDLVRGDTNGTADVFVRDRRRAITRRVSVGSSGRQADGESSAPAISASGRFVAFSSRATNLAPRDREARSDVFVRHLETGRTRLVSKDLPAWWARGRHSSPTVSANGRFVAFVSTRNDPAVGTRSRVFVRDRRTGTTRPVVRPAPDSGFEAQPVISAGGRFVVLVSSERLSADDRDEESDVFVVHRRSGRVQRVAIGRRDAAVHRSVHFPAISSDASRVAVMVFTGTSRAGTTTHIAIWDRSTGRARIVSQTASGRLLDNPVPPDPARPVGLSGDGRHVAFIAAAGLVADDDNRAWDLYVRDLDDDSLSLVTRSRRGAPADGDTVSAVFAADGRHVAFLSGASNLVPGDTNGADDVFVARRAQAR